MAEKRVIGFIGVGEMGTPMTKNLLDAGFPMILYDVRSEALHEFRAQGVAIAESPDEVARKSQIIITMLPNPLALQEVLHGKAGMLDSLNSSHIFIEMSTLDVATILEIERKVASKGARLLDCPVSGTPERVEVRDAELLTSGDKETVQECNDVFGAISKRMVYTGKVGCGKAMKLCNNMLTALNKLAVAETVTLALKLGLEADVVLEAVRGSNANSSVFERYAKAVITGKEKISTKHSWQRKDLSLVLETAKQKSIPLIFGELAWKVTQEASDAQGGAEDFQSIRQYYRNALKLE